MPEEIPTQPEETKTVTEVVSEIEKSPEVQVPVKSKPWLKPLLFSILGIILAGGLVFAGYKLSQKKVSPQPTEGPTPAISPEVTPSAGGYRIAGIDLAVNKALRVERKGDKDLLVLTVTFAANVECPLPGGAVCGYDIRGFRLVDEEGFVQDMLFSFPTIKYLTTNPISQRILKLGEKDKGDVFFEIPKDKNKFFLTYSSVGETTEKISIEPELFDPTANWKTYTNTKYGYSIRYPKEWQSFEVKEGPEAGIRVDFAESESFSEREYWVWTKVNNNPDGLSAKQWVDKLLLQYSDQQAVIAGIKREKDSVADVEAERVTGLPAMTEIVSVFIPKEKNIYEIVLQKGVGILSSENKDTFNLMLSTFRFSE